MRIGKFLGGRSRRAAVKRTGDPRAVVTLLDGSTKKATDLVPRDRFVVEAGEVIGCSGKVVDGVAMVDESAITGESAPVLRESGGDRSAVTAGTRVLTSRIVIEV